MFKNGDILHSKTNDLIVIFRSYRPEFGSENGVLDRFVMLQMKKNRGS